MNPDELPPWLAISGAALLWGYLGLDALVRRWRRAHESNEQEQ